MMRIDPRVGASKDVTRSERAADMIAGLKRRGVDAALEFMRYGDAAFIGNGPEGRAVSVGVELKTIGDLARCMFDGRLVAGQLPGMVNTYELCWLIVEGPMRPGDDGMLLVPGRDHTWVPTASRLMYRDLHKFLLSLQVQGHIGYARTWTKVETVQVLSDMYSWWSSDWDDHRSLRAFDYSDSPAIEFAEHNLSRRWAKELPGVGWEKSRHVSELMPLPEDLVLASEADYRAVPGIGKVLAARIYSAIHGGR